MKISKFFSGVLGAAICFGRSIVAQDFTTHGTYTEPNTGITFYTSYFPNGTVTGDGIFSLVSLGGFTFGLVVSPEALTTDSYDYIGLIIGSTPGGSGWSGVIHGENAGAAMPNHLMLLGWPTGNGDEIATTFRYSSAYEAPKAYGGTASITHLYSSVNETNWVLVYKCTRCFLFDDPSQTGYNMSTSQGKWAQGWGQATLPPSDVTNPNAEIQQHDNGMGIFQIEGASATHTSYSDWVTRTATATQVTGTSGPTATVSSQPVPTGETYDYVIIGGGAGGIPVADRLSATGKKVLLIEKGIASSARWGGTVRPPSGWLDGYNLTWFDVPGECNRIWNGGALDSPDCPDCGAACHDNDQMTGCVLGGGTAVNAGLWWKPNPKDWDVLFPTGWKASDMAAPAQRAFSRIPGTDHPSSDGQIYLKSGYDIIGQGLNNAKWANITANNAPGSKNRTYAYTAYTYAHGERNGPMGSYLVSAAARPNFKLWLNTSVERIVRSGGHATGLDVVAYRGGGYAGRVNLTPVTGRVIVAAGAFGTPKLLFRSGIGPTDQLEIVKTSTDGPLMINSTQWINLPVGYNLDDHLNTDTVISHPNITYYDWVEAWNTPIEEDKVAYLTKRAGPLTQAAPNIGPVMWEEVTGPDGILRQFQWTSRVEGSSRSGNGNTMTLSLYLGRGKISRGRTVIQKGLNMVVDTIPWGNTNDLATVAKAIDSVAKSLLTVPGLTYLEGPYATGEITPANLTAAQYLASVDLSFNNIGGRRANHWLGTAKIGDDSGLTGGTSVVNRNTQIYGTDNIFVVDASIFPGMPSTNPSAYVVTAAERAADLILALPQNYAIPHFGQCGGLYWGGSQVCASPYTCQVGNIYFSQCL